MVIDGSTADFDKELEDWLWDYILGVPEWDLVTGGPEFSDDEEVQRGTEEILSSDALSDDEDGSVIEDSDYFDPVELIKKVVCSEDIETKDPEYYEDYIIDIKKIEFRNRFLDSLIGKPITVSYVGRKDSVEARVKAYEEELCKITRDPQAVGKYKQKYLYRVVLFFRGDNKIASEGISNDYNSARKIAEGSFPCELSSAVEERVVVAMSYRFDWDAIDIFKDNGAGYLLVQLDVEKYLAQLKSESGK